MSTGKELVARLQLQRGQRVIDVGCGTGLLAEHVAEVVGQTGRVVGIDPLPRRVRLARQKRQSNAQFKVGVASDLRAFAAESFDAGYLHEVFHWLPDKPKALRELSRVLKTGARLGITTSADEDENTLEDVWKMVVSKPPYTRYRLPSKLIPYRVTANAMVRLLDDAGFDVRQIEVQPGMRKWLTLDGPDGLIGIIETISFGNLSGRFPEKLRRPALDAFIQALEQLRTPEGIPTRGSRIMAVAMKR